MSTDLLDTDVSGIDTSFPRIVAGLYELSIATAEKVANKAGTGENLKLTLKTTQPATDTSGSPVPAGFTITTYIALTETGKYTQQMIAKALASLMKSAGMSGSPRTIIDNPALLVGKVVTAKVSINKETDEFAESNGIKGFVVKA